MEVTGQESRFRAMFAEEAEERLATLSELLLELERSGDDRELLSSVFREAGGRPGGRIATLHTGRPGCGKIPMTGSSPTRHRETGILADQQVIGKVGRVTGTIAPERVGEVMIPIRGGSEAFNAYAADTKDTISTGTRVVVVEYFPPRTVVVSPL